METGKKAAFQKGHATTIFKVAYSPDSKWLVSVSSDQSIKVWDLQKGIAQTLKGHRGPVLGVAIGPGGRRLASASADATVKIWNMAQGGARSLNGHVNRVNGVAFSPDGRQLASAGSDKTVKIWSLPFSGPPGGARGKTNEDASRGSTKPRSRNSAKRKR